MRLSKLLVLAMLAMAVTALVGASSASALQPTQLCKVHPGQLVCPAGQAVTEDHQVLAIGTVWKLLTNVATILCLQALKFASPLTLAKPQKVHTLELSIGGCGKTSSHDDCTITVEDLPLLDLLKTGLDAGVLTALDGSLRVQCSTGLDCLFDLEGAEFTMGNQHTTANEAPVIPLGGLFFCPGEASLDFLLVPLEDHYVLK